MSFQDGHRQRVKKRFRQEGLDSFEDAHALELLLFYCIPRQNTKEIAYRLIDHFGSLAQVLDASTEELEKIEGIGENAATFLLLIKDLLRRYYMELNKQGESLTSIEKCIQDMKNLFLTERNEKVYLMCLDAKCKILCCRLIGEGSVNSASISVRKIVEVAINTNATTVILAHNHPGGLAIPSYEDKMTTVRIAKALRAVDIMLADHIIVANTDAISMVQSQYFNPNTLSVTV